MMIMQNCWIQFWFGRNSWNSLHFFLIAADRLFLSVGAILKHFIKKNRFFFSSKKILRLLSLSFDFLLIVQFDRAKLNRKLLSLPGGKILVCNQVKFANAQKITLQLICTTKIHCIHSFAWYCRIHKDMTFIENMGTKQGLPP